ncbi:YbjN domain-containing protein [Thalassobaculum sp.]|uniref:YbjN domain-containing protein n=1 Tax=Thalassobaculum sp. TaxID=2022740 RepID=UPI0032EEBBF1
MRTPIRTRRPFAAALLAGVIAAAAITSTAGASAADAPSGALQQGVAALSDWLRASGAGELTMSGSPTATARADGELVRLPGLAWRTPGSVIGFGDVEIVRTDVAGGLWRLTGALPARMTVDAPGQPTTVVSALRSAFDLVIDPRTGAVSRSAVEAGDISVAMEPVARLSIAKATVASDLRPGGGGRMELTSSYRIDDLIVTSAPAAQGVPAEELFRVKSIASEASLGGVDWPRLVELQALLATAPDQAAAAADPALARRAEALATVPDAVADGAAFRFDLQDARLSAAAGGPGGIGRLGFRFGFSGLSGDAVSATVGYWHDGLAFAGALPVDGNVVPDSVALEVSVEKLPGRDLFRLLESGDRAGPDLLALLQRTGATARIDRARVAVGDTGAELTGSVAASPTAPDGAVGQFALTVVNLDRIVAALGGLAGDELAALQLAAALGQRTQGVDGKVTHHWGFVRDGDGRSLLNGNDVSALFAQGLASLEAGPPDAPAPTADPTADPTAPPAAGGLSAALIAERLEELGLGASVADDGAGTQTVTAALKDALDGQTLTVELYDCGPDGPCGSGMMYLGVEPERQVPLAAVNDWNSAARWVRAYREQNGALWLELDIAGEVLGAGQVDALIGHFLAAAERFVTELAEAQ